tara:strand:- start:41 stop:397 length:357 start_codon:yes stop_codon:yes gene_type:complete
MNRLPDELINNILIIKYESEKKELKNELDKKQLLLNEANEILLTLDFSTCLECDKWVEARDLFHKVGEDDTYCENCLTEDDYLPCHTCNRWDYCDKINSYNDGNSYFDYCINCNDLHN